MRFTFGKSRRPVRSYHTGRVRPRVEALEQRALLDASGLATQSFQAPDLEDLIRAAEEGDNTVRAAYFRMIDALQSQLSSGPKADLDSGQFDGDGFVGAVEQFATQFKENVDQQISSFPFLAARLKSQANRIQAETVALNQQHSFGLTSDSEFSTKTVDAIAHLSFWPPYVKGGLYKAVVARTRLFESDVQALVASLNASAANPLPIEEVDAALRAEADAYQAYIAAYGFDHPFASKFIADSTLDLEGGVAALVPGSGSGDLQTEVANAAQEFDRLVLDTNGLLGPRGLIGHFFSGLEFEAGAGSPAPPTTLPPITPPPNPEVGRITIVEDTVNDTAQVFSYRNTGLASSFILEDFVNTSGSTPTPKQADATRTFSNLAPGTYTVTEDAVAGWTTTTSCTKGGTVDPASRTATITLTAGAHVTCTYTNQPPDATRDFLVTPLPAEGEAMHIHPILSIVINGQTQVIRTDIGIFPGGLDPIHTHDATGKIHVESSQILAFRLKDFFTVWSNWANDPNIVFTSDNILGHKLDDPNHQRITMTVDGQPNTAFGDLILKDGQNIVIRFETF